MEVALVVISVVLVILVVIAPLVMSIVALVRTRRQKDRLDASHVYVLAERIGELEQQVAALQARLAGDAGVQPQVAPEPAPPPEPSVAAPEPAPAAYRTEAPAEPGPPAETAGPARAEASIETRPPGEAEALAEAAAPIAAQLDEPIAEPKPKARSIEELLGGQVFQKVGIIAVALSVVFLLYLVASQMGPAGKVAIGYLIAGSFLAGGLLAERRERYRTFGRALIAGGWGILYFVTFALHFMPQARLVDSQPVAFLLMLAAASGAVVFSLRYRSEWTTTFAFLLMYVTLGTAAVMTDATYNLVATTIVSAALAFLVWRMGWDRLLALGLAATWSVLSLWLVPQLLATDSPRPGIDASALAMLVATWAVFSGAVLFRAQRTGIHEGWQVAAYMANMFGFFGLAISYVLTLRPDDAWMVPAATGVLYIAGAWAFKNRARRILYLVSGTLGLAALALVSPLKLGWGSYWLPITRMLGIQIVLAAGMWLRERWFRIVAYAAFTFTFLEILLSKLEPVPLPFGAGEVHFRLVILLLAATLALANVFLVRTWWREHVSEREQAIVATAFSLAGTLLLAIAIWLEVPPLWLAPALAGIAMIWAGIGRFGRARDFDLEGLAVAVATLIGAIMYGLEPVDSASGIPLRPIALGIVILCTYLAYAMQRLPAEEDDHRPAIAIAHSILASIALTMLIFLDVPDPWVAASLMALVPVCFAVAFRLDLAELLYEGIAFTLLAVVALAGISWHLTDSIAGLPARPVSVVAALVFLFLAHTLAERFGRLHDDDVPPALYFGTWKAFSGLISAYLALATIALLWWIKSEALFYGKNLLVALLWGLAGVLYLELARVKASRTWLMHGHGVVAAALVHLYLVNFLQTGELGLISLRVLTCVPFFFFLLYVYLGWDGTTQKMTLSARVHGWRYAYLYAMVAVVATLVMVELHRAWVIVGWAGLGVLATVRWRTISNRHWKVIGILLAISTVARGIAVNLTYRDEVLDWRLNLIAVPLACLWLLAGYAILRHGELRDASDARQERTSLARDLRSLRMVWLASLVVLLTGFVWVEAAGTILTVWLSMEGLFIVALGFLARERIARLVGLLMLSACIFKLVIYDLRGLSGIPRILSFLVLGLVLIAVSFVYTRFKERIQEYL